MHVNTYTHTYTHLYDNICNVCIHADTISHKHILTHKHIHTHAHTLTLTLTHIVLNLTCLLLYKTSFKQEPQLRWTSFLIYDIFNKFDILYSNISLSDSNYPIFSAI